MTLRPPPPAIFEKKELPGAYFFGRRYVCQGLEPWSLSLAPCRLKFIHLTYAPGSPPGALFVVAINCRRPCAIPPLSLPFRCGKATVTLIFLPPPPASRRRLSSPVAFTAVLASAQSLLTLRPGYINVPLRAFVLAGWPERAAYQRFGFAAGTGSAGLRRRRTVDYPRPTLTALFDQRRWLNVSIGFYCRDGLRPVAALMRLGYIHVPLFAFVLAGWPGGQNFGLK